MTYDEQVQRLAPPALAPSNVVQWKSEGSGSPLDELRTACAGFPVAAHKVTDLENETAPKAKGKVDPFAKKAVKRIEKAREADASHDPLWSMEAEVTESGGKYLCLGPAVPGRDILKAGGVSRLLALPGLYDHNYLKPSIKGLYADTNAFVSAAQTGGFDADDDLDNRRTLRGKTEETWWFPSNAGSRVSLEELRNDLYIQDDPNYAVGAVRLDMTDQDLDDADIEVYKPTAFDGMTQSWGDDPWWVPGDDPTWGLTKNGTPEAVMKAQRLRYFKQRDLVLPDTPPAVDEEPVEPPGTAPGLVEGEEQAPDAQTDEAAPGELPEELAMPGFTLHDLSGTAKWRRGVITHFEGSASATIAVGETNALDVEFTDVVVNVARGKLKRGTGTFTAVEAIPLVDTGRYSWSVAPGATGEVDMKNGVVTELRGNVSLLCADDAGPFLKVSLSATIPMEKLKRYVVDGTGRLEVLAPIPIPGGLGQIEAETAGSATIVDGRLARISAERFSATLVLPFGENGVKLAVDGRGDYDHDSGLVESAEGSVTLLTPLALGAGLTVDTVEGSATVEQNALVAVGGKLGATYADDEGELLTGSIAGDWSSEGEGVNGSASLKLARDVEWTLGAGLSVVVRAGSGGDGEVTNGAPSALSGKIAAELFQKGEALAAFEARGRVDVAAQRIEELSADASLKKQLVLLDGGLTVDEITAHVQILDGLLVGAGGTASLTAKALNIDRADIAFDWRNDGTQDYYAWSGDFDWELFKDKEQYLGGHLGVAYHEDGTFEAAALVDYVMGAGFHARADLAIDSSLEPLIRELTIGARLPLMDGTTLFDLSMNVLNLPFHILILALSLGLDVGATLTVDPLTLDGSFSVFDWKPTKDTKVPDFRAELEADWGLNLEVWVGAYVEAALDIFIASAGIGCNANLVFGVPVDIHPSVVLEGGSDGVAGTFGLSVAINPKLFLDLIPYLEAYVIFIDTWRYDMADVRLELADLGSFEWSDSFSFGESKRRPQAKPAAGKAGAPQEKARTHGKSVGQKDNLREGPVAPEKSVSNDIALPGGETISGAELMGQKKEGASGDELEDGTNERMSQHERMFDGLKAIDDFIVYLGEAFTTLLAGGPVFGPILLAWEVIAGDLSFDRLAKLFSRMMDGLAAVGEFIEDMGENPWDFTSRLGQWLQGEITLYELLMNDDDEVRKAVRQGLHRKPEMGPDQHGGMLYILCHPASVCVGEDEDAVISICRVAGQRGHLREALTHVKGSMYDGADQVLWKLDGSSDTTIRKVFDKYGIDY